MPPSRKAYITLTYEGKDITRDISPFLLTFTFTDNASGTADDISFTLEDRKSIWLTDWMPSKGDRLKASIVNEDSQTTTLTCGEYDIDQIEYSYPPRVISIKGVSASIKKAMKGEKHSRAWENVSLSAICSDIAGSNGLALHYDGGYVMLKRREQVQQSDLEFLEALCADHGLNVKISDGKLIVYSESQYDSHSSVDTIDSSFEGLISCKFTSKSAGTYRKAKVKYHHPVKAQYYEGEYEDDDEEGSERELEIYERVDSESQAQEVAQEALTKANSKEVTASLTVKGDTRFLAGLNVTLTGFGMFSGKYFIDKVVHTLGSGYTTQLSLKMGGGSKKALKAQRKKLMRKSNQHQAEVNYIMRGTTTTNELPCFVRFGTVSDYDAQRHMARIKFPDRDNIISGWLPVSVMNSSGNHDESHLDIDAHVMCLMQGNGTESGVVMGSIYDDTNKPPGGDADIRHRLF